MTKLQVEKFLDKKIGALNERIKHYIACAAPDSTVTGGMRTELEAFEELKAMIALVEDGPTGQPEWVEAKKTREQREAETQAKIQQGPKRTWKRTDPYKKDAAATT